MLRDERGAMAVLVAAALVVLSGCLALAADVGQLALWQVRAANAADAAALAGAQELMDHPGAAFDAAMAYGQANGIAPGEMTITVTDSVAVDIVRPVEFAFAPVLGIHSGAARAHARAVAGPVTGVSGVAPLAVPDQEFEYGALYQLKANHWQKGHLGRGEFGALGLGEHGADHYRDNLKKGYPGMLRVGDVVPTESGNMSGPTQEAIADRFARCNDGCTFDHFTRDCPRVLIVPVYEPVAEHKVDEVRIAGFAAFWVENIPGNGDDSVIEGRFVQTVTAGTVDPDAEGYGLYGVRLIE
ncbi:MAG: pilus assembly protein TadG-related protein [Bacillota bacterium]|nr:pilus assembly protein TadG-related protein [Bacillota bacterium]